MCVLSLSKICIMHVKKRIFELRITNLVFNLWDSLVAGVVINSASNLGARVPSAPSLPPPVLGMVLGCVMRRTQSRWLKKVEKGWKRLKKVEKGWTPMKTLSFPIGMEIWGPKKNFFGHSMDAWLRMRRQATWDHGSWTEILAVQWCCAHFWWSSQWLMMI